MTRAQDAAADLAEALGVDPRDLRMLSREPLGEGSVAGYAIGGNESAVAYVDTSLLSVPAETGARAEDGTRVWLHPADPHLPALAPAAFGDAADILLQRLGLPPVRDVSMVGYRPGRRAVLRIQTATDDVWVKVVRPDRVERIIDAHRALGAAGVPVPRVRGWSPDGLIALEAASGDPVTQVRPEPDHLLDATEDLRRRFAAARVARPARTSVGARLPWYLQRMDAALPGIASGMDSLVVPHRTSLPVTIHGDLHVAQLFFAGRRVSGVIDVDTAGVGDPADDSAAFLGHAIASALSAHTPGDAWLRGVAAAAVARWANDPVVPALTAVHLLGHALSAAERGDTEGAESLVRAARAAARHPKTDLMADLEWA